MNLFCPGSLLFYLICSYCLADPAFDGNITDKIFVPTRDWKVVHSNQQLPPGLHIRQNLQTGLTEAKLLDPEDAHSDPEFSAVLVNPSDNPEINNKSENVVPPKTFHLSHLVDEIQNETFENTTKKFRSYDELKADFRAIHASFKTDVEIVDDLMKKLQKDDLKTEDILVIFEDLSYLLHQFDNGRYFADKNGFALLHKFLVSSDETVQKSALSVSSAAVQGNSAVKVSALQAGHLDTLHKILTSTSLSDRRSQRILSSGLTALGALLRDFPSAQNYFFMHPTVTKPGLAGFELLASLYDRPSEVTDNTLRIRVLRFVADLILERSTARQQAVVAPDKVSMKLWKLYSETDFETALVHNGWCERMSQAALDHLTPGVTEANLDTIYNHSMREDILISLSHIYPICFRATQQPDNNLNEILEGLVNEYFLRSRTRESEHDFYYSDLYNLSVKVNQMVRESSNRNHISDEL